jgi:hypothetical protein
VCAISPIEATNQRREIAWLYRAQTARWTMRTVPSRTTTFTHGCLAAKAEKPNPAIQNTLMVTACQKPWDCDFETSRNSTHVINATKS